MAKYKFDLTDFNLADFAEYVRVISDARPEESIASKLFGVKALPTPEQRVAFWHEFLELASRFTDGYSLSNVPLDNLQVFVKDFTDAAIEKVQSISGES